MSIQPSVIFWTVVSFLLLLVLLNRFLFKPLLTLMHDRDAKIAAGIAAGETARQALAEAQEQYAVAQAARRAAAVEAEAALTLQCRQEAKEALAALQAGREARWTEAARRIAGEQAEAAARLDARLPELTAVLADALLQK